MTQEKAQNPSAAGIAGGGSASTLSQMMRNMVESTPLGETQATLSDLPDAPLPPLEDVEVKVSVPMGVTEEDMVGRFQQLCYESADRTVRKVGDKVELGDEILIDMMGYVGGQVLPFSAQQDLIFRVEPDSIRPGFGSALIGATVGDTLTVTVPFSYDDLVAGETKINAVFVVSIKGAAAIHFPDDWEAPAFLARLGRGNSLEEVMEAIAEEIADYQASALVIRTMDEVMATLAKTIYVPLPDALVNEEIRAWWRAGEGAFLASRGLPRADLDSSLEGWLNDETIRNSAKERLKIAMVVRAYLRETAQELTAEEIEGFVDEFARVNGIDAEAWKASMADNEAEKASLVDKYLYMRTVSQLMEKVKLTYEAA